MCVMLVAVFHIHRCGFMLFYLVLFSFSSFISRVSVHHSTFILGLASHPRIFYFLQISCDMHEFVLSHLYSVEITCAYMGGLYLLMLVLI